MLAAQVQAASLPPLACFDGSTDGDDNDFLQWLERFEERARLSKWTEETKVLRYIKDWVKRVHAMIDGRGQIDYSIVPNSRLRLIFKYKT